MSIQPESWGSIEYSIYFCEQLLIVHDQKSEGQLQDRMIAEKVQLHAVTLLLILLMKKLEFCRDYGPIDTTTTETFPPCGFAR